MASTSRDRASTSRSVWVVKDSGTSQQELTGNALPRYGSPTKKSWYSAWKISFIATSSLTLMFIRLVSSFA